MYARRRVDAIERRPGEEPCETYEGRSTTPFDDNARARRAWAALQGDARGNGDVDGDADATTTTTTTTTTGRTDGARELLRRLATMPSEEEIARWREIRDDPWTRRALEATATTATKERGKRRKGGTEAKDGKPNDDDARMKKLMEVAKDAVEKANEATRLRAEESARFLETRNFAGKMVEVETEYVEGTKEAKAHAKRAEALAKGGIDAVLAQLMEPKKLNVLDKTRADWRSVKDDDAELQEDLQHHARGGRTYREQQEFLQNADYREYELERDARLASRGRTGARAGAP